VFNNKNGFISYYSIIINTSKMSSYNRISGKTASDAFKGGNNSGMNFLKESKRVIPLFDKNPSEALRQNTLSLHRLRASEKADNGDLLRGFFGSSVFSKY